MKLLTGHLNYTVPWTAPDVYIFTGNSTIKQNGAIVMGRGAAKEVRDTIPGIDTAMGSYIQQHPGAHLLFLAVGNTKQIIGWFKVKEHWRDDASLLLIAQSTMELALEAHKYTHINYHINYPGVGNGRLDVETVGPLLSVLPDNVIIYR
jgi:hypothetical protein